MTKNRNKKVRVSKKTNVSYDMSQKKDSVPLDKIDNIRYNSVGIYNPVGEICGCIVDVGPFPPPRRYNRKKYFNRYFDHITPNAIKGSEDVDIKVAEDIKPFSQISVSICSERKLSIQDLTEIKTKVIKQILKEGGILGYK